MGMFENDYAMAWAVYLVGALGLWLVWMRLTGWLWRFLREPLGVLMAVMLFSPALVDTERQLYAPAIAIIALDLLFEMGDNALSAFSELMMFNLSGLVIYVLFVFARWLIVRRLHRQKIRIEPEAEEDERTLEEQLADLPPLQAEAPLAGKQLPRALRIEPHL